MIIESPPHGVSPFLAAGQIDKGQNGRGERHMFLHVGINLIFPFIQRPDFRCDERGWRGDEAALQHQSRGGNQTPENDLEYISHGRYLHPDGIGCNYIIRPSGIHFKNPSAGRPPGSVAANPLGAGGCNPLFPCAHAGVLPTHRPIKPFPAGSCRSCW